MTIVGTPVSVAAWHQQSGSRHAWNARLCDRLERMAWGRGADLSTFAPQPRSKTAIVTLPVFVWDIPAADTGRKSRSHDGGQLRLPIRVRWAVQQPGSKKPPVELHHEILTITSNEPLCLRWKASGAGHALSGHTTVIATGKVSEVVYEFGDGTHLLPTVITAPTLSRLGAIARLHELVEDGRSAQWEAITETESHLTWAFERAHAAVRIELLGDRTAALDQETKNAIKDTLLFGSSTSSKGSYILRLLDRCLQPGTFERVDPQRYMTTALVSGSETAIRRHLGDPHIGRKIRRLRQEKEWASADELVAEYNRRYPNDILGPERVGAALTADLTMPRMVSFTDSMTSEATDDE